MTSMTTTLAELDFFVDLDTDVLAAIAGCGHPTHIPEAAYLFQQGEPADAFYAVRQGRVAIEVHDPRFGRIVIDTVEAGDVVGWSWLVPPYRWLFDAQCLRQKCDVDPTFGYALLQRVIHVMHERLQASRVRLLDLYGVPQ